MVQAERGYDAQTNYEHLLQGGTIPVILMRRPPNALLHERIYTTGGVPTCVGMVPMQYVRTDPEKGYLYRCAGCHLATRRGVKHCEDCWQPAKMGQFETREIRVLIEV